MCISDHFSVFQKPYWTPCPIMQKLTFIKNLCAVLFDGLVGEQAWPEDDSVGPPLTALSLDEIQEIIRADPGKAESLFEKRGARLKRNVAKKKQISNGKKVAEEKDRRNIK